MQSVLRDFPDHAETISKTVSSSPSLSEACRDYDRLSNRLHNSSIGKTEADHIKEILSELRAEILRLVSRAQALEGRKPE